MVRYSVNLVTANGTSKLNPPQRMNEQIYCLMTNGGSIPDVISDALFIVAQKMLADKDRKKRLSYVQMKLTAEVTTDNKLGMMGAIAGITFEAKVDWDGGSIKTIFIVRPFKDIRKIPMGGWKTCPRSLWDPGLN